MTRNNMVLKYNSNWQLIGKDAMRKAFKKVYKGTAVFSDPETGATFSFDTWLKLDPLDDYVMIAPYGRVRRPKQLICVNYNGQGMSVSLAEPRISRWNVYVRDNGHCCFCGRKLPYEHGGFTFDHLHPKSKGGEKDWNNIVLACRECNHKKANKVLEESGMTLLKKPYKPTALELRNKGFKINQEILLERKD